MPLTVLAATRIIFGWSPRRYGASLLGLYLPKPPYIWQDAARTTPAAATNPVGGLDTWTGGGAMTLTGAAGARPTSALSGGIYSLTFDGIANALSLGSLSYGPAGLTFCAVASLSANGSFPMLVTGTGVQAELRCSAATRQPEMVYGTAAATWATAMTIGQRYMLTGRLRVNAATGFYEPDLRVNGVNVAGPTAGVNLAVAQTSLNIGQRIGGTNFWPGSVYGAAVVTSVLGDATALKLEKWLAKQCGLAI